MFLGRRILAGRTRIAFLRRSFRRKSSPGRNYAPLLITIGLILAIIIFIYPLGAESLFVSGYCKTIVAGRIFGLDYFTLISNSLPGLVPQGDFVPRGGADDSGKEANAGIHIHPPSWQDYPQMLLSNELAGLQVLATSKPVAPDANGDESDIQAGGQKEGTGSAVFLTEEKLSPAREKPFVLESGKPQLLIYHTHTSESFIPISGKIYATDLGQTIVFLGRALAETLEKDYGISVLHHQEVFDRPRSKAYQKACPAIEKILQENPQIQVVLDLHRDGVSKNITTAKVFGQDTARVLFVIETRNQGWHSNLRFGTFLENILQEKYPNFSRGILKNAYACYNQHLHSRSLIVEIGGHENSREELMRAIPYLAEAIAAAFEQ